MLMCFAAYASETASFVRKLRCSVDLDSGKNGALLTSRFLAVSTASRAGTRRCGKVIFLDLAVCEDTSNSSHRESALDRAEFPDGAALP